VCGEHKTGIFLASIERFFFLKGSSEGGVRFREDSRVEGAAGECEVNLSILQRKDTASSGVHVVRLSTESLRHQTSGCEIISFTE
jgi:hypothetical protein